LPAIAPPSGPQPRKADRTIDGHSRRDARAARQVAASTQQKRMLARQSGMQPVVEVVGGRLSASVTGSDSTRTVDVIGRQLAPIWSLRHSRS
jgi:hypothetical protein